MLVTTIILTTLSDITVNGLLILALIFSVRCVVKAAKAAVDEFNNQTDEITKTKNY